MISRLRYWALAALAAGLLGGSAAWAQTTRTVQTDPVRYALALEENPDAAGQWRFRVAVSIPREGADYGIPVAAVPSRLMFRAHKGDVTAFDGSILLSRLLPANAGLLYPMPQNGDTPDTDGVESGDASALAALDDGTVAAPATDPLRWEAVYASDWYNSTGTAAANALLASLLEGQATHEWYAASRYGIGSFTRISDIQDAGRKQTFRDARLWAEASGTYDWAGAVDDATRSRWGAVYDWQSVSMTVTPWEIHGGVVNVSNRGVDGVHLLGIVDEDGGALPRLVSPVYPDGVSAVTFKASLGSGAAAGETPRLDVQVLDTSSGAEAWTTVASVTGLTNTHQTFTVSLGDALPADSNGRFRIVRATPGGKSHTGAIAINDLLVRSASPTADFSTPGFSPDPLYPRDGGWQVVFQATSDDARGYSPEIALRRRADGDDTAQWHAAADVSVDRKTAGDTAELRASFLPGTLETYSTGAVNAVEGAFFTDSSGAVTGLLPGVYDLRLTCDVLGSFAAGRENIDEHETVRVERATYDVTQTDDDGQQVVETHPFVVDLRERETAHAGVVLEATYRVDGEGRNEYAFFTREVEMLPSSADPNVWRVDVQRVLRLEEDETAVWAWAPDDLIGQEDPTDQAGEENILSFRIRATAPDGSSVTYYGQTLQQASATLPPTLTAVPSSTATLASADAPGRLSPLAVPLNIANSHVAVEVTLADAAPAIVLRGSYWQDFNSWFAVSEEADSDFSNTDFRENVASVTAGFDVRDWGHDSATDERTIAAGWMPDEGPFARTTSITDAFGVARLTEQTADYAFYYRDTSDAINGQFAQWGAASDPADPGLLRADDYGEDGRSQYFDLDGGAEVVLRRTYSTLGDGTMMPDAAIRLTPTASIEPSASVKLNGVGTVSFDYTLSIPYDFSGRVQLVQAEGGGTFPGAGYGIAAGIPSNASQTYSPSGVSVSYYLEDVWGDRAYELRLTEVVDFPSADFEVEPTSRVYAELYRWNGSTATRLRFQDSGDGYAAQLNHSHLAGHRYGLWVNGDRRLVVGVSNSATGTAITATKYSQETVSVPSGGFRLALNSAECRPTFRYVAYASASGNSPTTPLLDGVAKRESNPPGWATSGAWTLGTENDRTAITLTRVNPPSDTAGRFVLRVQPESGARVDYPFYASSGATQTGSFTVGQANATLSLLIESGASGVYLDNVTVTSWCGDDTQRNGDNVPDFTDLGFSNPDGGGEDANGFAAVGVWVRPEDDAQLTVSKDAYEGRQVLVMQRSRKNTNGGEFSEGRSDGGMGSYWVTGASLALYTPHNRGRGFGSVSFRYRIPQAANGGSGSAVRLLLQFREDNNYTNDYLGSYARDQYWVDVSSPILLSDTSGDWATASVVPRFASGDESGQELVGRAGTLRLVMLIPDEYRDDASYDPCVWLDDVTVTDNRSGVLASWAAGNAKLTTSPVDLLYWKDRAAAGLTDQVEQTFAERAGLTKALHLNDAVVNTQVSDAYLESPALENGVGRLTFAARLAASNPTPVRLYVSATTSTDEDLTAEDFTVLASLDVTNTVYRVYDLDLAAATFADAADDTVTHKGKEATRLRLWTVPRDFAGAIPDAHPASYGQVLIDRLAIEDPVAPSLRVTDVAFSNDASGAFDSKSPLSQPVSGATDLRVQATLGNKQRVKPGSVRVFYSFATTDADALRATAGYTYTDALGGDNSAGATRPIYRFQNAAQWDIGSWLGEIDPAAVAAATDVSTLYPNTLELEGDADETTFTGSLAQLFPGLLTLPPNSLVRYAVWAIYQAEAEEGQSEAEANEWYCSVIDEADYTEFPWYFPRNLNAEMQARDAAAGFSPYYWVYSCVPGEAFINEFNLTDASPTDGADLASFIELCFPATLDIDGWGVAHTVQGGITNGNYVPIDVDEDAQADMNPDAGVVPARRAPNSSSNRTFYTVANGVSFNTEDAKNAGWAKTDNAIGFTGTNYGVAVYLYRPTGGAEHIVVFSSARASTVAQEQQRQNVADTYNDILGRTAPFGGTWSQAFLDTTWQAEIDAGLTDEVVDEAPANDPIGLIGPETTPAEMHGRRLAVAETFQADANGDYAPGGGTPAYVQDNDDGNAGYANSIATVDMGGKWVTRRNKINEASVADLTHLTSGNPLGFNPTQMARAGDDRKQYQVTPRQINLDQWLIPYTGLSRCAVVSRIEGGLGRHTLEIFDSSDPDSTEVTDTRRGGVDRDGVTWTVGNAGSPHVNLIYDALPYHHIASVRIRLRDSVSGSYLGTQAATEAGLPALVDQVGVAIGAPDADGWAEVTVGSDLTQIEIPLKLYVTTEGEVRFTAEAVATFALSQETDGGQVITSVRPYVGEPSGADRPDAPPAMAARRNQPWRGSGFGFEVGYTAPVGAELSSVLVFYPDPGHVGETGLDAAWVGATALRGFNDVDNGPLTAEAIAAALNATDPDDPASTPAGVSVVQLNTAADGWFYGASGVPILGTAYDETGEPLIPFVAWGVYTVTFPTDSGTQTVSFLLRQAVKGETAAGAADPFAFPEWYKPLTQESIALPYFYLYATPPESVWLNEVNLAQGSGSAPYAEVVFPVLRAGIVEAGVPQATPDGWKLRTYNNDGTAAGADVDLSGLTLTESGSASYAYAIAEGIATPAATTAYVVIRPCGAAEGGVWTGVDDTGGTDVAAPEPDPIGLINVFPGVTDSSVEAGSVQLVGQLTTATDPNAAGGISSVAAERTEWAFEAESRGADNDAIRPDTDPDWNRVTFLTVIRNATYGSGTCGTWLEGYFATEGATGQSGSGAVSKAGPEWVYDPVTDNAQNVFSYKPRAGYCFESIQLPPELIGHVMLVGQEGEALTATQVKDLYERNIDAYEAALTPEAKAAVASGAWLTPSGSSVIVDAATGLVTFDRDYTAPNDDTGETFADKDDFIVTLLFVDEPASAQGTVTVSFAQGETGAGAWLATQTFYALDAAGNPIYDQGGEVVVGEDGNANGAKPIWDDETGNAAGAHKNVHGWLHQPLVGDRLGMAAVLTPSFGLIGGNSPLGASEAEAYAAFDAGTVRPFLVWALTPAGQVPDDLFTGSSAARRNFLSQWALGQWVGATPAIADGITTSFSGLRTRLQSAIGGTYVTAAGIIPMTCLGRRGADGSIVTVAPGDDEELRLAFRTMTQSELETFQGGAATPDGQLPYATAIDMDGTGWANGAVLRFAIILADPAGNVVYDLQGIANFSSADFDGYCPWYVPDDRVNINAVSAREAAGVSPFAWVYDIAQDGVWLNEIRPFTHIPGVEADTATSYAVELAMEAAPVALRAVDDAGQVTETVYDPWDPALDGAAGTLIPQRSLTGWKVVTKVAELPQVDAPLDVPLEWDEVASIDLHGWVPFRRIEPLALGGQTNEDFYALDFYAIADEVVTNATSTVSLGFRADSGVTQSNAYNGANENTFRWFPAPAPLDTLPEGIAGKVADYTSGVLYAFALVRDNGAVVDEVLFQDQPANAIIRERLQRAIDIENATHAAAATVRGTYVPITMPSKAYAITSFQFVERTRTDLPDEEPALMWNYDGSNTSSANTLPGINGWKVKDSPLVFAQPRSNVLPGSGAAGASYSVSAQILGGDGSLALARNGLTPATGPAVSVSGILGDTYALSLETPWNPDWFTLKSITRNGAPYDPAFLRPTTTFALNAAATGLSETRGAEIAEETISEDVDYVLSLGYTPDAERLSRAGALDSEDAAFEAWLRQVSPEEILAATARDGVSANEKFWLGFGDAAVSATEVSLAITRIGTQTEGTGEGARTLPAVSVALTNGDAPIDGVRGDGALLLLGTESLDAPEWRVVRRLHADDLNGERVLVLDTPCNFFRAILLSVRQANELPAE